MEVNFVCDSQGNIWTIEDWDCVRPLTWGTGKVFTQEDAANYYDPSGYNE